MKAVTAGNSLQELDLYTIPNLTNLCGQTKSLIHKINVELVYYKVL